MDNHYTAFNNNSSKLTRFPPVQICNIEKDNQMNKEIYSRNIPLDKNNNLIGYRSSYKICQKYRNMHNDNKQPNSHQENYTRNIDVESKFRYNNTKSEYPLNTRGGINSQETYSEQFNLLNPKCSFRE